MLLTPFPNYIHNLICLCCQTPRPATIISYLDYYSNGLQDSTKVRSSIAARMNFRNINQAMSLSHLKSFNSFSLHLERSPSCVPGLIKVYLMEPQLLLQPISFYSPPFVHYPLPCQPSFFPLRMSPLQSPALAVSSAWNSLPQIFSWLTPYHSQQGLPCSPSQKQHSPPQSCSSHNPTFFSSYYLRLFQVILFICVFTCVLSVSPSFDDKL